MAGFDGLTYGGASIESEEIKHRQLNIVIPTGVATESQKKVLEGAAAQGASVGVEVKVMEAK